MWVDICLCNVYAWVVMSILCYVLVVMSVLRSVYVTRAVLG